MSDERKRAIVILARALGEDQNEPFNCTVKAMLAFAAAERQAERERCAKVCRDEATAWRLGTVDSTRQKEMACACCAKAIEALK